jgi:protein-tyrosine kinase
VSKIFEALRKTEGGWVDAANAVLADEVILTPAAAHTNEESVCIANPMEAPGGTQPGSTKCEVRVESIQLEPGSPLLPFDGTDTQAAEQYRIIRTKIHHHPAQPRMLLISSAMSGDGKTINAINLAAALSLEENLRVLLLDCDFRRSSATNLLGLAPAPGLAEVLRGEVSLEASLVRIAQFPNLYLLPPGNASSNPAELLSTARWRLLMEEFQSEFGFVIVDAPPIGAVADYELLQQACDGVIVVVRQDYTNRQLWQRALETVPKTKQLGVILNCAEDWFLWKTHSYYYYSGKVN